MASVESGIYQCCDTVMKCYEQANSDAQSLNSLFHTSHTSDETAAVPQLGQESVGFIPLCVVFTTELWFLNLNECLAAATAAGEHIVGNLLTRWTKDCDLSRQSVICSLNDHQFVSVMCFV